MYETYYGLSQRPFSLLPNPALLYPATAHKAAIDVLQAAFACDASICLITGDVGAGKTTLKLRLMEVLGDRYHVGNIANANDSFCDRPSWILRAFDLEPNKRPTKELYRLLMDYLRQLQEDDKKPVLIIDESQVLSVDALQALHHFSIGAELEDLPVQIVLFGQSQLRETLKNPSLQPLLDNIAFDHHLTGLTEAETRDYIAYRIRGADGDPALFTDAAVKAVFQQSGGIPRIINVLCDTALVYGFMEASPVINSAIVTIVGSDRQNAGLTEGMWQAPEPVVMQTGELPATGNGQSLVEFHLTAVPPVPLTRTDNLPTLDTVARSPTIDSTEKKLRRGRILDTISIVLVIVLGVLVWLGRDSLFQTVERPVASVTLGADEEKSDFATLGTENK